MYSNLLWRRWYVKAMVATVVVVALLAVVWFVALKPTYTADEVTKKMETYLRGKVYEQGYPTYSLRYDYRGRPELEQDVPSGGSKTCYQRVKGLNGLATPHYIPYRKAWRITTVSSSDYTWLFDERTGTIASSNGRC